MEADIAAASAVLPQIDDQSLCFEDAWKHRIKLLFNILILEPVYGEKANITYLMILENRCCFYVFVSGTVD